jgi:dihydropteroate synthase
MKNFSTSPALFSRNLSLNLDGRILNFSRPRIMGIINASPDSFHGGSRFPDPSAALEAARTMIREGAHILDVGAVSSRPGATEVSEQEELERLVPVMEAIRSEFPDFPLSVDTWRSGVARRMREQFHIHIINDISAGRLDPEMFAAVAELGLPYIMMHMQGTPDTMQESPEYVHVVDDLLQYFAERVYALRLLGVNDIIIDPGFGFGKTLEQNYQLLRELHAFQMFELPILVGLSRKSMIYNVLDTDSEHALNGTTAAHMAVLEQGANLIRVHDVKEAAETIQIFQQIVEGPVRGV